MHDYGTLVSLASHPDLKMVVGETQQQPGKPALRMCYWIDAAGVPRAWAFPDFALDVCEPWSGDPADETPGAVVGLKSGGDPVTLMEIELGTALVYSFDISNALMRTQIPLKCLEARQPGTGSDRIENLAS